MNYYIRTNCRICGNNQLHDFISLGATPLADSFPPHKTTKETKYPLVVKVCPECKLVQLVSIVDDKILFGKDYAFFTGASPSSIAYFEQYAKDTVNQFPKQSKGLIVEIASNDGTLLKDFVELGCDNVIGIDPAVPPAMFANANGIETLVLPFNSDIARKMLIAYGSTDLLIANNVVAHVDNLLDFMKGVKTLLSTDGVFIFECHYFPNLLFSDQFDNIYHEHRSFFSLLPLTYLFNRVGLYMFDIRMADTQGGSIRVFVSQKKKKQSPLLKKIIREEFEIRLDHMDTYAGFQSRVNYIKQRTVIKLKKLKEAGYKIYGYGASAKGNTMLNVLGLDTTIIDKVVDKTPYKIGKFTPGTKIPVVMQSEDDEPNYYLLLVWNYLAGVLEREKEYRKRGGKFIVPTMLPSIL